MSSVSRFLKRVLCAIRAALAGQRPDPWPSKSFKRRQGFPKSGLGAIAVRARWRTEPGAPYVEQWYLPTEPSEERYLSPITLEEYDTVREGGEGTLYWLDEFYFFTPPVEELIEDGEQGELIPDEHGIVHFKVKRLARQKRAGAWED